jgi:ethanolamine ammonia-lyase large subunit
MNNADLIQIGAKVFNPLPASNIGARGYMGARVQPNSPTDNVDDIRWQVFDAFAYGVGDVLLGTNPVSSTPESVAAVETTLQDVLATFGIEDVLPHCVLSHIDVQAEVENAHPDLTDCGFKASRVTMRPTRLSI